MSDEREPDAAAVVQAAALEAIRALRSFLDLAEGVVRDPSTAATVGRAFADAAASVFRPGDAGAPSGDDDEHDQGAQPRVRRIDLSE